MTVNLFFDTETTGIWNYGIDMTHDSQPNVVQIGAVLCDDGGIIRAEIDAIVYPECEIPPGASNVHGISTDLADKVGIGRNSAAQIMADLISLSDRVVAHNLDFDVKVMRRLFWQAGINTDPFDGKEAACTMKLSTDILRLPSPRKKTGFKWPSLSEAHKYFTGAPVENAHNAMVDVKACIKIYDGLKALQVIK